MAYIPSYSKYSKSDERAELGESSNSSSSSSGSRSRSGVYVPSYKGYSKSYEKEESAAEKMRQATRTTAKQNLTPNKALEDVIGFVRKNVIDPIVDSGKSVGHSVKAAGMAVDSMAKGEKGEKLAESKRRVAEEFNKGNVGKKSGIVDGSKVDSQGRYTGDKSISGKQARQALGAAAEDALNIGSVLPAGGVVRGAKIAVQGGKAVVRAAGKAAVEGAAYGAAYGGAKTLQDDKITAESAAENIAGGTAGGAVVGGVLGAAGAAAGRLAKAADRKVGAAISTKLKGKTQLTTLPADKLKNVEFEAPDKGTVLAYKNMIAEGKDVGPIKIVKDSAGNLTVEDGKHRLQAYKELGIKDIPVEVEGGISQGMQNIGEKGVVAGLNKTLSDAGRSTVYRISDMLGKTTPGRKVIDAKDDFMTKWVSNLHPLYKTLKRSDFEGKTNGAYVAAREAIGNSNRALSFAQDFIENNQNMKTVADGIASRGANVIKSRKTFDEYAKVKSELDLVASGKKRYDRAKIEELTNRAEKLRGDGHDFEGEYQGLVGFYSDLNEFRYKEGLISEADYKRFKDEPFDYVRQQREIPDWMKDKPGGPGAGSKASITKSAAIQSRNKYADGELLSPLETAVRTAQSAHVEAYRNRAAKTVTSLLSEAGEAKMLRTTDVVREKQGLLRDLKESKPIVSKMYKVLRSNKVQADRLAREIQRLEDEGYHVSQMGERPEPRTDQPKTITVKQAAAYTKDNAPKTLDELKQSYTVKAALQKEYGSGATGMAQIAADIHNGGWSQLMELNPNISRSTAKSLAAQVMAEPTEFGVRTLKITEGGGRKLTTKQVIENLITADPKGLKQIRNMIENRDSKLSPLMDQIELMGRDLHDLHMQRSGIWNQANAMKTTVDKKGLTSLSFLDDGVENIVKIDPAVASAIHDWDAQSQNVLNNFLRVTNNIFKYGTTGANAGFALPNFVADQIGSAVNSRSLMATHNPVNFARAFMMTIGKPIGERDAKILQEYTAGNKGALNINQYTKPATSEKVANELMLKNADKISKTYTLIRNPKSGFGELFNGLEALVGSTEQLTRVQNFRGAYTKAAKEGLDASRVANQAARENSIDFLEMGSYGRVVNSFIPYFNASIQGSRTMLRNAAERPASFAAKTAALVGMPVAMSTMWNLSDPKREEIYKTIPDYVKATNLVVISPNAQWNEGKKKWEGVYLMKKPPGMSEFAEPVRRFLEFQASNDPNIRKDFMKFLESDGQKMAGDFLSGMGPVDFTDPYKFLSSVTPQALKPTAEAILNKNFFTGEDIVKDNMKDLPADQQKYKNYSKLTSAIAQQFNTSPLRVDQWIKDTFGEVGTNAVNTVDRLSGAPEEAIGGRSLEESVTRRFYGAPGGEDTNAFYKAYNPASAARKAASKQVTELVQAGEIKRAKRVADEFNASIPGHFQGFWTQHKNSPTYSKDWDEQVDKLEIPVTVQGFAARKKQK